MRIFVRAEMDDEPIYIETDDDRYEPDGAASGDRVVLWIARTSEPQRDLEMARKIAAVIKEHYGEI